MNAGRQAECGLRFFLELQIQRRQSCAEAQRSRRQEHVLPRRIDGRTGSAGRGAAFEVRDDPNRGLMDVCGEIFRRVEEPDYQCCIFPPLGALTRANSASEKVGLSMKLPLSI